MSKKAKYVLLFLLGGKIIFLILFLLINAENNATENSIKFAEVENLVDFTFEEVGIVKATWYGNKFHGRLTASGEVFNQNDLTAAHRTLPFGTLLKLVNEENGSSVIIRINDRGPVSKRLDLDLSKQAAIDLGIKNKGVSKLLCFKIDTKRDIADLLQNY